MMKAAQVEKIHDRSWRVALVGSSMIIGQAGCWRVAGAVRGGGDSIRLSLRKSLLAGFVIILAATMIRALTKPRTNSQ